MKINVFCCRFDLKLHSFFQHEPQINVLSLRFLNESKYLDNSVILISEHSTNKRLIRYIRRFNVLTPIYIVSKSNLFYSGINGSINIDQLNYQNIRKELDIFPQRNIWNYVFKIDQKKRKLAIQES